MLTSYNAGLLFKADSSASQSCPSEKYFRTSLMIQTLCQLVGMSQKELVKGLACESHIPCKQKVMGGYIGNALVHYIAYAFETLTGLICS